MNFNWRATLWNIVVSKTNDHIQIKVKITNPGQESPASSKTPNKEFKDPQNQDEEQKL